MRAPGQTRVDAALGVPAVRARFLQLWLTFPERFDPDAATRLLALIGEEKRRAIQEVSMLSWLPIELDVEIVDAVAGIVGAQRFHELTRAYFAEIVPRPPLGALLDLGTKMIGLSPQSFLRWWDRGWSAVYRACGKVKGVVIDDCHGRIVYEHLPHVCIQSEAFVEAVLGSSFGIYALTGHQGSARIAALRREDGYLEVELAWRTRRES